MARTSTYLNFSRNTEAAFLFYQNVFGTAFLGPIMRMGDIPNQGQPPLAEADKNLVMNVALPILGGHILMGTDAPESMGFTLNAGNNLFINLEPDTLEETQKLFEALSPGGKVGMPLQQMFWGAHFGSLTDQFGIQWMFNCPVPLEAAASNPSDAQPLLQPRLMNLPAFAMLGHKILTQPASPEIPQLWANFRPSELADYNAEPKVTYGLMQMDLATGILTYMAGVTTRLSITPAGFERWEFAANDYAVFEATLSTISQTFDYIYGSWLPNSSFQRGTGPDFERYGPLFDPQNPNSTLEIYIPVLPQSS